MASVVLQTVFDIILIILPLALSVLKDLDTTHKITLVTLINAPLSLKIIDQYVWAVFLDIFLKMDFALSLIAQVWTGKIKSVPSVIKAMKSFKE